MNTRTPSTSVGYQFILAGAVDQVRRRGRKVQNASTKSPWWKARWHLLRKQEALTEQQKNRLEALLQEDELIRRAYDLKERLR